MDGFEGPRKPWDSSDEAFTDVAVIGSSALHQAAAEAEAKAAEDAKVALLGIPFWGRLIVCAAKGLIMSYCLVYSL